MALKRTVFGTFYLSINMFIVKYASLIDKEKTKTKMIVKHWILNDKRADVDSKTSSATLVTSKTSIVSKLSVFSFMGPINMFPYSSARVLLVSLILIFRWCEAKRFIVRV